jgi:hypothetical protein
MKLVFKKDEQFSEEFKDTLGAVDADFSFEALKADLRTATTDLIKVIGLDTYNEIADIYENGTMVDEEQELLDLTQYVVAIGAYTYFAPFNDLQHGPNGRKMLTDADSKTPFEHLLVASNDELQRRTYRAMDDLLRALDMYSDTWKASTNYKDSHSLFVRTTDEFDQYYIINSRLLLLKLRPGIAQAEKREIIPRISKDVFDVMKEKRNGSNNTALTETESLLLSLIQEACVYSAISWGIIRLQATLFPEGVLQATRGDSTNLKSRIAFVGNQPDQISEKFKQDALEVLQEIERVLSSLEEVIVSQSDEEDDPEPFGFNADDKFVTS